MRTESENQAIPTVTPELIGVWAERRLFRPAGPDLPLLTEVFRDILWTTQRYVPSESGSI